MKKQPVHVKLEDPTTTRKMVLELAIDTIGFLKNYEKLKLIRKEKDIYKRRFKEDIAEINKLIMDLDGFLPKVRVEEEKKEKIKGPRRVEKEKGQLKVGYLNKFESDINRLRAKIEGL